jgi:hypothetical protein
MNPFDTEHMDAILHGYGDWFTAHLFRLIAKADPSNQAQLAKAFPQQVEAVNKHLGRPIPQPEFLDEEDVDEALEPEDGSCGPCTINVPYITRCLNAKLARK